MIKTSLNGLLFICLFSVLFTSCSKEELVLESASTDIETQEDALHLPVLIPDEVAKLGKEAIDSYLATASKEDISKLNQDFVVSEFLKEKDKLNQVSKEALGEQSLSDLDLGGILSADEQRELQHKLTETELEFSRNCILIIIDVYTLDWCYFDDVIIYCEYTYDHTEGFIIC